MDGKQRLTSIWSFIVEERFPDGTPFHLTGLEVLRKVWLQNFPVSCGSLCGCNGAESTQGCRQARGWLAPAANLLKAILPVFMTTDGLLIRAFEHTWSDNLDSATVPLKMSHAQDIRPSVDSDSGTVCVGAGVC